MKSQLLASGHLLAIHKQEKLILLVKQNPPIYDKKDRANKERKKVANIWQDIYITLTDQYLITPKLSPGN